MEISERTHRALVYFLESYLTGKDQSNPQLYKKSAMDLVYSLRGIASEPNKDLFYTIGGEEHFIPPDIMDQIIAFKKAGKRINAVKLLRTTIHCGLKEAVDFIDSL